MAVPSFMPSLPELADVGLGLKHHLDQESGDR